MLVSGLFPSLSSAVQKKYGYTVMVMVGDGATDLEARREGGADIFIG